MSAKLKVVRVVTIPECIPWFLDNTLRRIPSDFNVCVIGQSVSRYKNDYPGVDWFDIDIRRDINLWFDIRALFALCKFFLAHKPDIVHSMMPKAGLLSALAGYICRVPVRIHTFTGQVWTNKVGPFRSLLYFFDKFINLMNSMCLTDGPAQSAFLLSNGISDRGNPLRVLLKGTLSGINMNRFEINVAGEKAVKLRRELNLDTSKVVFSFVARKNRVKGAIDILHTFAKVSKIYPDAWLLFIGPDESGGELDALFKVNPDIFNNVLNIGLVDNHEIYLAASDVNCLPSYREGFSTITLDAAALGVPTIGSNIPGLMDAIEDGKTGILFPVGDLGKLFQSMIYLLENPHKRKEMGRCAREMVELNFTADQLYDALKALYFEMSGKSRVRH